MAQDTPGSKDATWKPKGSAYDVPAAPKTGPSAADALRRRAIVLLATQGALLLMLLAAAALAEEPSTRALYLWAGAIPLGFGLVFLGLYLRGARVRREGLWSREWERAEGKRAYAAMGVVLLVWIVGLVVLLL